MTPCTIHTHTFSEPTHELIERAGDLAEAIRATVEETRNLSGHRNHALANQEIVDMSADLAEINTELEHRAECGATYD